LKIVKHAEEQHLFYKQLPLWSLMLRLVPSMLIKHFSVGPGLHFVNKSAKFVNVLPFGTCIAFAAIASLVKWQLLAECSFFNINSEFFKLLHHGNVT
jgi:poly(A) polymerase Pap1